MPGRYDEQINIASSISPVFALMRQNNGILNSNHEAPSARFIEWND